VGSGSQLWGESLNNLSVREEITGNRTINWDPTGGQWLGEIPHLNKSGGQTKGGTQGGGVECINQCHPVKLVEGSNMEEKRETRSRATLDRSRFQAR